MQWLSGKGIRHQTLASLGLTWKESIDFHNVPSDFCMHAMACSLFQIKHIKRVTERENVRMNSRAEAGEWSTDTIYNFVSIMLPPFYTREF